MTHGSHIMGIETSYGLCIQGVKNDTTGVGFDGSRPAFYFVISWRNVKVFWNLFNRSNGESLASQKDEGGTTEKSNEQTFNVDVFHEQT